MVRFEQSRDGDDESCTCSLAFGLDVLSMMELCDEIFYKLKWLSWPLFMSNNKSHLTDF